MEFHEFWTMKLDLRGRIMKSHGFPFPNSDALLGNEIPYLPPKAACEHIVQLTSASVCDYSEFPEGNSRLGRLHLLLFRSSSVGHWPTFDWGQVVDHRDFQSIENTELRRRSRPGTLAAEFFFRVNAVLRRVA